MLDAITAVTGVTGEEPGEVFRLGERRRAGGGSAKKISSWSPCCDGFFGRRRKLPECGLSTASR